MSKTNTDFDIIQLPTHDIDIDHPTESDLALAQKYQKFRLYSLQNSPQAFASSYDIEITKPLDYFLQRLANPHATFFVATIKTLESSSDDSWAGLIILHTIRQPSDHADDSDNEISMAATRESSSRSSSWLFDLNGTYVHPNARGRGVGLALMNHALQVAQERVAGTMSSTSSASHWSCRVLVDSENEAARRLYEKAGFAAVGTERYTPQARSGMQVSERTAVCLEFVEQI